MTPPRYACDECGCATSSITFVLATGRRLCSACWRRSATAARTEHETSQGELELAEVRS